MISNLIRAYLNFFIKSFLANKVLEKYNPFLKFFKRRVKFRLLIKKKVEGKNKVNQSQNLTGMK